MKEQWTITETGKYRCNTCKKEYTRKGIGTHIWRSHGKGQNHNPNKGYEDGSRVAWNKGLTKEENKNLERSEETRKKISKVWKGRKHSEETRKKISKSRIEYLQKNPDKVPYLINHSSKKSYPETIFENALIQHKIDGWEYGYQNGIYQYDFAFLDIKLDVEIDGGTHTQQKVIKIDKRRDEWSKSEGWNIVRFTAKEVKENVESCIEILQQYIGDKNG